MPAITLPDGSVRSFDRPVTCAEIAASISPGLASQAIGARGLRSLWAVDLPPGTHQVRVATVHPVTGRSGSMYVDLVVHADHAVDTANLAAVAEHPMPTAFIAPEITALLQGGAP